VTRKVITIAITTIFLALSSVANAQLKLHMVGFKVAYNTSGVNFNPKQEQVKTLTTKENFSIEYIYYHDLWQTMPYFGFQIGLSSQEQGYSIGDIETHLKVYEMPFVSQFHIDFWQMRLLINLGGFVGYRSEKSDGFTDTDYKTDYGFIAGAGFAFILKPFELHIEGNYQYSLSSLYDAKRNSSTVLEFAYPHQLLLSAAIYIHLNK